MACSNRPRAGSAGQAGRRSWPLGIRLLAGPLAGLALATPAVGADWSLNGQVSQTFSAETNRGLENPSEGTVYGSTTSLGLTLGADTKRSSFRLSGGVDGSVFFGPGDTEDLNQINPRNLAFDHAYQGKTYTFSQGFSFDAQQTSDTQLEDTGITEDETTQFTVSYGADLALRIDAITLITFALSASAIEFAEDTPGLTATRTIGYTVGLSHELTSTTSLNLNAGARLFTADDAENTRSGVFDIGLGLTHQRTPRHTFGLNGGVSLVRDIERITGGTSDFTAAGTGGASFAYTTGNFNAGLSLTQSVDPSSAGELQSFTRLGGNLDYAINDLESVGMTLALARRTSIGDSDAVGTADDSDAETLSLGANYSLRLGAETSLGLGYAFNLTRDSIDGTASGHRVFLTLSRALSLLQ